MSNNKSKLKESIEMLNLNPIIKVKQYHNSRPNYIELENGIWIRSHNDGTGANEKDHSEWEEVMEQIGEDEYHSLGWRQK